MAIDALLVAAACALTEAPTSSRFSATNPLNGATTFVSSSRICAMRCPARCCATWVSARYTWLSVVVIWTRATSTWASWARTAACEASCAVRALSRSCAETSPFP